MNIRTEIYDALVREIIGPSQNPAYTDEKTGEEILLANVHGNPKSRYGAGMLYPQHTINKEIDDINTDEPFLPDEEVENVIDKNKRVDSNLEKGGDDEEPVGLANQYLPSAMGFTAVFNKNEGDDLIKLCIKSAYYEKSSSKAEKKHVNKDDQIVTVKNKDQQSIESEYWIRRPITLDPISLNLYKLFGSGEKFHDFILKTDSKGRPWLKLRVFNRSSKTDDEKNLFTLTFVIVNELNSVTDDSVNSEKILYQNELRLITESQNLVAPYKEKITSVDTTEEEELKMLYRKKRIFSIGHGASVKWTLSNEFKDGESVSEIYTSVIPTYELSQVAPTSHVELSMLTLSDIGNWDDAKDKLVLLSEEYGRWIDNISHMADSSSELEDYRKEAKLNVLKCRESLARIRNGVNLLIESTEDSNIVKSFRWMNRAMIWQQQRSKTKLRKWVKQGPDNKPELILEGINNDYDNQDFMSLDEFHASSTFNGRWRPFQLAFILMNLESISNAESKERQIVDLIWFPTGGGKTEAYLGLTAFNVFFRRLKGEASWNWSEYDGTTVIMRYTLRLLTTQQYERAASLICACDIIREENKMALGETPISIGLWVGGQSSPNKNKEARDQLTSLRNDSKAEYNFVVMKCPCCGAQIGKIDGVRNTDKIQRVKGLFVNEGPEGSFYFKCENIKCEYNNKPLPLQVVDELIYHTPPTLLIGTVDKFAMIPWKREAGKLFGFREKDTGAYRIEPPELIIQDELHLIAGPLGTMVGLYETMVQTLCNNYNRKEPPFIEDDAKYISPKIIASSATISRAFEQVKGIYGIESREQLQIFPAQGLSFGDTWFSEEKPIEANDNPEFPGRKYIGILASGFPSAQTSIVRSYAAVLQKIKELAVKATPNELDYYWTLMGYFNSIRELGGASSLVYGDIRERLGQIQNRDLVTHNNKRYINKIEELTSRISSSEIPGTLKKLEKSYSLDKNEALDICLATNMVATGVDISRLGLMFIHGQPKTTAEYIQASSRVGREVPNGPGIIITLYSPSKPRDKSQYEQFQAYHSRIYSNVEPTSVTPFSINAREKGIHAILIGLIRHFSSTQMKYSPTINEEFEGLSKIISKLIVDRCTIIDQDEAENTQNLIARNIRFWRNGFQHYGDAANIKILQEEGYVPLMFSTSSEVREEIVRDNRSLATPTSMRGVDGESRLSIYSNTYQDGE